MTGQIGLGVMIRRLGSKPFDLSRYQGSTIISVKIVDERVQIRFGDGKGIELWDDGQSCCESRYMSTDDDIQSLCGHKLTGITAKDGPTEEDDYKCHEQIFVEISTSGGFITLVNHNEHNGYYGGFGLAIAELK